jgi:anti-anti-sigma factor
VLDLSDLAFASSADLSMLVKTLQRVEKTGVKIALTGLQENLRRIFEIKRMDRMFPMTATH